MELTSWIVIGVAVIFLFLLLDVLYTINRNLIYQNRILASTGVAEMPEYAHAHIAKLERVVVEAEYIKHSVYDLTNKNEEFFSMIERYLEDPETFRREARERDEYFRSLLGGQAPSQDH